MSALLLRFLGTLEISHQGRVLPMPATRKSQSLLAYLVMYRDRPHTREKLAGIFWGGSSERNARHSLATSLWHIRCCLPDVGYILTCNHTLRFNAHHDLQLDVDTFEHLSAFDDHESLLAAIEQYHGDFLEGFYDNWVISERYRLKVMFVNVLARLMVIQEDEGDYAAALNTATGIINRDSLREDAHRLVMRAYCKMGQRNAALEQYRRCSAILQDELGVKPMAETDDLYKAILEGES